MFKRIVSVCLMAILLLGIFSGCGVDSGKLDALVGTWTTHVDEEEEYILEVLTFFELYEDEIALVETTGMQLVKVVEFHADRTYSFRYDGEGTRAAVRSYLEGVFQTLYEKREQLDALYEASFALYSQEAFQQFYAALYEKESFDALLDSMADEVYDYTVLDQPYETGTFKLLGNRIYCTKTGETEANYLEYTVTDTALELVYLEGSEVYQKAA